MYRRFAICFTLVLVALAAQSAFAYDFWGVTVGSELYDGAPRLTFSGIDTTQIQYEVGAYKYTKVENDWLGPFDAPAPGAEYLIGLRSDAQGIFFRAEKEYAHFMIIATSSQDGFASLELGYGDRLFGPGDLKIDVNGNTYGIGLRKSGLPWAQDPYTTIEHFQLYNPDGNIANIYSRDAGTLGKVELNPDWARAGRIDVAPGSDLGYAFYVSGSGTEVGTATVDFTYTGICLSGAYVYAYDVLVPWNTIGLSPENASFTASWRPDCGNDIISAEFSTAAVPEPTGFIPLATGLVALLRFSKK